MSDEMIEEEMLMHDMLNNEIVLTGSAMAEIETIRAALAPHWDLVAP